MLRTEGARPGTSQLSAWRWYATAFVLCGYGLLALAFRSTWAASPLAAILLAVLFLMTVIHPVPTLAVTVILFGAAGGPLGSQGIDVGIRVYPLDFILAIQFIGMLVASILEPTRWHHDWPLKGAFVLLIAYLTLSLAHGLAAGNALRDALGDYRRMAIYPLALVVLASAVTRPDEIALLLKAVASSSFFTALIAVVRIATGVGFAEEHLAGTTIRYLSYVEASTAGLGVLILLGFARAAEGRSRLTFSLAALVPFAAVLVSNYRTAWLALGIGLFIQFTTLGWRRGLRMAIAGAVLFLPVAYVLIAYTRLGDAVLDRFNPLNAATSGLWRYFSWVSAMKAWLATPWLGTGLGYAHHFEFFDILTGDYAASTTSSIHNDPLWFLVNNGVVGLAVFSMFAVPWIKRAFRLTRTGSPFSRQVASTSLGGLALMLTVSCLQPYFSTAATTAIGMVLIALVLRCAPGVAVPRAP